MGRSNLEGKSMEDLLLVIVVVVALAAIAPFLIQFVIVLAATIGWVVIPAILLYLLFTEVFPKKESK